MYIHFIYVHSFSLKELKGINQRYTFAEFDGLHCYTKKYDNEIYYNSISPKDYLIYKLVSSQKKYKKLISLCINNRNLYDEYSQLIPKVESLGRYDVNELPRFSKFLNFLEKKICNKNILDPDLDILVNIELVLTNIKGNYKRSKSQKFYINDLEEIIYDLNQKSGDFYLNRNIWDAICRVERGKVSNKMRFYIYKRDGYRCQICGRKTDDLEIDHIFPIAKGGKTTIDNLQTLCRRCNFKKSDNIY